MRKRVSCVTEGKYTHLVYRCTQKIVADLFQTPTSIAGNSKALSAKSGNGRDYMLMGGMTAALAGVMAKMGMKWKDDDESTTSGASGIVSKRMSLLQKSGGSVSSINSAQKAPSFINISNGQDYAEPELVEADEGIEVEGPYRPSSQYAI